MFDDSRGKSTGWIKKNCKKPHKVFEGNTNQERTGKKEKVWTFIMRMIVKKLFENFCLPREIP